MYDSMKKLILAKKYETEQEVIVRLDRFLEKGLLTQLEYAELVELADEVYNERNEEV